MTTSSTTIKSTPMISIFAIESEINKNKQYFENSLNKSDCYDLLKALKKLTKEERVFVIKIARQLDNIQEEKYSKCIPDPDRTNVNLSDDLLELYFVLKYWTNKKDLIHGLNLIHNGWAFSKCINIFADDMANLDVFWNAGEFAITCSSDGGEDVHPYQINLDNFVEDNIIKSVRRQLFVPLEELKIEEQIKDVDTLSSILSISSTDLITLAVMLGLF